MLEGSGRIASNSIYCCSRLSEAGASRLTATCSWPKCDCNDQLIYVHTTTELRLHCGKAHPDQCTQAHTTAAGATSAPTFAARCCIHYGLISDVSSLFIWGAKFYISPPTFAARCSGVSVLKSSPPRACCCLTTRPGRSSSCRPRSSTSGCADAPHVKMSSAAARGNVEVTQQ
jgi:hypothetical protein